MELQKIISAIAETEMSSDDLEQVRQAYLAKRDEVRTIEAIRAKRTLRVGMKVSYKARGVPKTGVIEKINVKKAIIVVDGEPPFRNRWNVPLTWLKPIQGGA